MAIFTNQATLSYSGGTINSNITTGEILEVLSVTKTAIVDQYSQGSDVTYAINIINTGNIAFTGLTVTDDLGAYTFGTETLTPLDYVDGSVKYFVNGDLQATPAVVAGPPLVISGIQVPANGTATVIYTATANAFAPPAEGGTILNTVTVNGGGITEITDTETIDAETEPSLDITKSVSPSTVTENGQLTYTFVIRNTGASPATIADNVVVTDTFDPILSGISVIYDGTAWAEGVNYTYDETTGVFATVPGEITVPAATFTQNPVTGVWVTDPGEVTITVTGII